MSPFGLGFKEMLGIQQLRQQLHSITNTPMAVKELKEKNIYHISFIVMFTIDKAFLNN